MENMLEVLADLTQEAGLLAVALTALAIAALRSGAHRSIVAVLMFMAGITLTAMIFGLSV